MLMKFVNSILSFTIGTIISKIILEKKLQGIGDSNKHKINQRRRR